ncbi:MAG: hypothetical protein AB1414_13570 [bacterium]
MKKGKNKGLLDKKRFEWIEEERKKELRNLTMDMAVKQVERFLSSRFVLELKGSFRNDTPCSLKIGLKRKCS